MFQINEYSIISESANAVQVQIVTRPAYRKRNLWCPRSIISFTSAGALLVPLWFLRKANVNPA